MEPTDSRICAFTYVNEKDLPEGQKLLRCLRCQETFYVNLEAMAEHLPVHRQVCCALHEDAPLLELIHQGGFERFEEAMGEVVWIAEDPDNRLQGRSLLYALQQALSFLKNRPGGTEFNKEMIRAYYKVVYALDETLSQENRKIMWAIPGFVNYFLGPNVWNPLELEVTGGRLLDGEVLSAGPGGDQSSHGRQHGPQLNGLYCSLLTSILLDTSIASPNNLNSQGQGARLQACVTRHFFQMWSDRRVSTSWPETLTISFDYGDTTRVDRFWEEISLYTIFKWAAPLLEQSLMRPHELVPGLTVKNLLVLLMEDKALFGCLEEQENLDGDCKRLLELLHQGGLAFSYLTTEDCIELFKIAEKWKPRDRHVNPAKYAFKFKYEGVFPENLTLFDLVLYLLTLEETKRIIDLKHSLLAKSTLAHAVVNHYYQGLMDETMPLLRSFLEAFKSHQRQLISKDEQPIEVPEEIVQHIAEFVFPDNIPADMLYIHREAFPLE